jgi:dTDP-4-dehydrorhamnose reductase
MKVLVTGAGGFVGQRIADRFRFFHQVTALSRRELDITSAAVVDGVIADLRPDFIINCAVLGVEACEADRAKAQAVNVDGPRNLARVAAHAGAVMVHFSTNYVFDGMREGGYYTIDDEPRPINVYGRTKLEGERAVAGICRQSFIVRTSWVYGGVSNGFFDKAIESFRQSKEVQAIADNWACTTFVGDLVERVAEIVECGRYGTYHVANDDTCSKYDFAVEAAQAICGNGEFVESVYEADTGHTAKRPRYTPMRCKLSDEIALPPMRDWKSALREHLSYENSN